MVFVCGVFEKWLDHEIEVLINEISILMKETPEISFPLPLCEDKARWQSINQEEDPHQTINLPVPWTYTSKPLALWEINIYCLSHSFYTKQPKIMLQNPHLYNGFNDNSCLKELSWQLKYLNHLNIYYSIWYLLSFDKS